MIVDGRKTFLEELCLTLKRAIFSDVFVTYEGVLSGINLKKY